VMALFSPSLRTAPSGLDASVCPGGEVGNTGVTLIMASREPFTRCSPSPKGKELAPRRWCCSVALALNPAREKEVLGLWIEQSEGAKFWLKVVNKPKARGVNDILIATGARAFRKRSRRCFRRPWCRPASCI
jgi:Transposase, Mutator family